MTLMARTFAANLDRELVARIPPVAAAMLFGLFLVYGIGFAQPAEIHNAAHDTRHAFAFPCH